ncbi:CatB-related O-acetyltransferase [Sphingomonas sp. JC676]|uniref:CatB-related O-acetyltransferase n=1 Tax=Sphingomonas sp. JC676 TaxID=2768065 RepID=UPI00223C0497
MIGTAIERARMLLWRRKQSTSTSLREYFRTRYDIDVGMHSYGCFDRWRMPGPLKVGRYCSVAGTARIVPANHPHSALTTHPILYERKFGVVDRDLIHAEPLVIEDDVWIGQNAILLPGCKHIGRGAIVGAGAVVSRNVGAYQVVAGVPARKIKDRFRPEIAEAIEASRWWERDVPELARLYAQNPSAFTDPAPRQLEALFGSTR